MKPGDVFRADFRAEDKSTLPSQDDALKIVQWNIERGYELDKVIAELRALDADILGLQEIDINCERSQGVDTGLRIAEALQLNYAFVCEFEELHSPLRDARSQGGGFHGNAILSKFPITDARALEHRQVPSLANESNSTFSLLAYIIQASPASYKALIQTLYWVSL